MLGFTQEEIYWKSLQFAVPTAPKPILEKGMDYKLAFCLAVLSLSFITVLSKRLWSLCQPLPVILKQPTSITDPDTDLVRDLLKISNWHDIERCSRLLNAVRVEIHDVVQKDVDRIQKLERIINICNGTDDEVRLGAEPLEIVNLLERLKSVIKVCENIEKHKSRNNNMVRLDIYLLSRRAPYFIEILDNTRCIFNVIADFRDQRNEGNNFAKKESPLFDELIRDIEKIVLDLQNEKNDFQKWFSDKMKRSFLKFAKTFELPNYVNR